jgi:hypothetical protein
VAEAAISVQKRKKSVIQSIFLFDSQDFENIAIGKHGPQDLRVKHRL